MSKTTVIVSCPIDTYSGYGARSRDFVKALIDLGKYDVKILSQRWGNTRFGYLEAHGERELASLVIDKITARPDVWVQVTVPNEFQKVGTYNIGLTAGIETTICDPSWIEGCNRMDLVMTSSEHAKGVFHNSKFKTKEGKVIELSTPVEVLFEGVDLNKYFPTEERTELSADLDDIKESFCFLFVGHWLQGKLGHDRKNVGWMVQQFFKTFKNKKNAPALILKTQHANASISDRNTLIKKVNEIRASVGGTLPNVYILHGEISDKEINSLYNHPKVKAMLNFTKGEGFGRPILEFSAVGKPLLVSGWSGHIDYLHRDFVSLVGGKLHNVDKSAQVKNMILPESQWFQADGNQVKEAMKSIHKSYNKYGVAGKRQGHYARENFSYDKMVELLGTILDKNLPTFAKQVELNIPSLNIPKLQKLDLPKL